MFSNLKLTRIFLLGVLFCGFFTTSQGQNKVSENKKTNQSSTCEHIKHALDYSLIEAKKNEGAYLIFIFRLGKEEVSKSLNQSRMNFIKKYLRFRDQTFDPIIFAQGEKTDGLARIEIYVAGKLEWILSLKKNKKGWDSCIE